MKNVEKRSHTHLSYRIPASCCLWRRLAAVCSGHSASDLSDPCLVMASSCSWHCGWCAQDFHSCLWHWTQFLRAIKTRTKDTHYSHGYWSDKHKIMELGLSLFLLFYYSSPPGKNQSACWMIGSIMPTIWRETVVIISVMLLQKTRRIKTALFRKRILKNRKKYKTGKHFKKTLHISTKKSMKGWKLKKS